MLESLYIDQTNDTPLVDFNLEKNTFLIEGISIPENTTTFYSPIRDWMIKFMDTRTEMFQLDVYLHYFNTSSNISLINFFMDIQKHNNSHLCAINWYYELDDEDMLYKGEELSDITSLKFTYIVK